MPHAITVPGFSSRSQVSVFQQFPQRDGADMSDMQPEAGFSNSEPAKDAPEDVHPDIDPPEEPEPGFSNSKAVRGNSAPSEAPAQPAVEQAKSADEESADEPPAKKATKKAAAKKSAKKG